MIIPLPTSLVMSAIAAERIAQNAKWGEQNHPDGTGPELIWAYTGPATWIANTVRAETQRYAESGYLTWQNILLEEVAEAFAEFDPAKLRAELVQVAAVAAAWIEAIDRRTPTQEPTDATR
jgi:hypothetical protein